MTPLRLPWRLECPRRKPAFWLTSSSAPPSSAMPRRKGLRQHAPLKRVGRRSSTSNTARISPKHIEAFHPTFCKVVVRYNPEGDRDLNKRQAGRLKQLSDYLHRKSRSLLMFELLVTAEKAQLARLNGDKRAYDIQLRPALMVQAIEQLQEAQVEPDVWKIEGLDRREDCTKIVAAARRGGRDHIDCIILARGEDDQKVREWLSTASTVPGFIGFAVGRTSFWDPLVAWRAKKITRAEAVNDIVRRYREFVDIFEERARAA
jgi:myo-inositol catabolism protein IolC